MTQAVASLLPHQAAVVGDTTSPVVVLVGGFRAGKTVAAVAKLLVMADACWPLPVIAMEPTYRMIERVLLETARRMWSSWGVPFVWRSASAELIAYPDSDRPLRILCVSAERPENIMGVTAGGGLVDEWELCGEQAVVALRSRLTPLGDARPQLVLVGTPEGFGFGYRWTEEAPLAGLRLVRARTVDNRHVDASYVEGIRAVLSDGEAREKLEGIRTAREGVVFSRFNRALHCAPMPPVADWERLGLELEVWADFNVNPMTWLLALVGANRAHIIEDVIGSHTDTMRHGEVLRSRISSLLKIDEYQVREKRVRVICDAAGEQRHTSSTQSDVALLTRAGYVVRHPAANPRIEDSIASVQRMLAEGRLMVDPARAPYAARCLESLPYDKHGAPSKDPKLGLDHGADCVRYGVHFRWPAWKPMANDVREPLSTVRSRAGARLVA